MSRTPIEDEIRQRVDQFVGELSGLIRAAAFQSVQDALGGALAASPAPARRGPGSRVARKKRAARGAAPKGAKLEGLVEAILDYISSNPGQRLEEISVGMRMASAALKPAIRKLLADGRIRTVGQARGTRYHAGGGGGGGRRAGKKKRGGGARRGAAGRKKAARRKKAGRRGKKAGRRSKAAASSEPAEG